MHSWGYKPILMSILIMAVSTSPLPAISQESERNCDANPVVTLPVSPLDIHLELEISDESKANFVVSFMDTNTTTVHRHIDYAFEISDSNGTLLFSAAPPGQPVLHTAEGVVTIPYTFHRTGDYSVNVIVYGVDFISTIPQIATFPCNNIPEFSAGFLALAATAVGAVIFISRYKNPKLS